MALLPELLQSLWKTALALGELLAGTASGRMLNALLLMLGFFVLLVLSGTRARETRDKADRTLAFAFFAATCAYSAVLGSRLSVDLVHVTGRDVLSPLLSSFTLTGRAAYLVLLAAGTLLTRPVPPGSSRWRTLQISAAIVAVLLLADRLNRFASESGAGPLTGMAPRPIHLALHISQIILALAVVAVITARFRPLPSALLCSWVLLFLSEIGLAAEHLPQRSSAASAAVFSQLTFLLHVPILFIAVSLRDRRLLFDAIRRLRTQFGGVIEALLSLEEISDTALRSHSQRHGELARSVALRLGMSKDQADEVYWAALLHDIGKLGLDRELFSLPRPLTSEEWALIRRHPVLGARVLDGIPGLEKVMTYIRYHHERWDGSGYPEGLRGESIPPGARIVALIDAFDAMIGSRAYRRPRSLLDAVKEVREQGGKHFDPAVVGAFLTILDEKGIPLSKRAL